MFRSPCLEPSCAIRAWSCCSSCYPTAQAATIQQHASRGLVGVPQSVGVDSACQGQQNGPESLLSTVCTAVQYSLGSYEQHMLLWDVLLGLANSGGPHVLFIECLIRAVVSLMSFALLSA